MRKLGRCEWVRFVSSANSKIWETKIAFRETMGIMKSFTVAFFPKDIIWVLYELFRWVRMWDMNNVNVSPGSSTSPASDLGRETVFTDYPHRVLRVFHFLSQKRSLVNLTIRKWTQWGCCGFSREIRFYLVWDCRAAGIRFYLLWDCRAAGIRFYLHNEFHGNQLYI